MILRIPDYYTEFACAADKCKHTCCASWEIDVDEDTYEYYRTVEGEFGERLRSSMKKDKHTHFQMHHGRCPFLDRNQLCEIYQHLGEEALCEVCTEYPRFEIEYLNVREKVLAISCEEAASLLFSKKEPIKFLDLKLPGELDDWEEYEFEYTSDKEEYGDKEEECVGNEHKASIHKKLIEAEVMPLVKARDKAIELLQDRSIRLPERIVSFLRYSAQVQEYIDKKEFSKVKEIYIKHNQINRFKKNIQTMDSVSEEVANSRNFNESLTTVHTLFNLRLEVIMNMEVMEEEWIEEMNNVERAFAAPSQEKQYEDSIREFSDYYIEHEYEYENLIVYFVYRYLIKSVYDDRFLDRAKFCVVCYLTIFDLDRMRYLINGANYTMEDRIDTARIFCKEIEHSQKSLEYLSKSIAKNDVFDVEKLIQQVLFYSCLTDV